MYSRVCLMLVLLLVAGCGCGGGGKTKTRSTSGTQTQSQSFLMNADDLDMDTISALVKSEGVSNSKDLQDRINDPASGINNVDVDSDGKVDAIVVSENRDGDSLVLNFDAVPSSTQAIKDAQTVAFLRVQHNSTTNQVHISGGYPSYVQGGGYYSYHVPYQRSAAMDMAQTYFLMRAMDRMFTPSYVPPPRHYSSGLYSSRSVAPASQVSSTRTTYRKSTSVSPVKKTTEKPKGYQPSKSAKKTASTWSQKGYGTKKGSGTVEGSKGKAKSYQKTTKPKRKATGFGAKSKKKSSWGGSKKPRKSSWGSSKRKSSWGGSSRSRSRRR